MKVRNRTRLVLALSITAIATVPLVAIAAHSHQQSFKANLIIHYFPNGPKSGTFDGHLGTAEICKGGRTVDVKNSATNATVGTAITDHSGQWGGVPAPGPGTYYASVSTEIRGGYQGAVCEGGNSLNTATVP